MDDDLPQTNPPATGAAESDLAPVLAQQRERMKEFVQAQRERLQNINAALTTQVEQIAEELAVDSGAAEAAEEIGQRAAELDEQTQSLAAAQRELEQARDDFAQHQEQEQARQESLSQQLQQREADLDSGRQDVDARERGLQQEQREIVLLREELNIDTTALDGERERLEERERRLDEDRTAIAQSSEETQQQSDRMAEEFRQRTALFEEEKTSLAEDVRRLEAELGQRAQGDLEALEQAAQEKASLAGQLAERDEELTLRASEIEEWRSLADGLKQELATANQQYAELQAETAETAAPAPDPRVEELETACDQLMTQFEQQSEQLAKTEKALVDTHTQLTSTAVELAQAREQAAQVNETDGANAAELAEELDDLRRRYEMSIENLKEERSRRAAMETKLAVRASGGGDDNPSGDGMDWESQKRRLLASLESDFDEDEETDSDRLAMEEVVSKTDEALADKDREIAEMHRLLEQQSANVGNMAVGAAAVAEVLDQDEVIRQERDNLNALQEEWREKQRKAEVEISMERAKVTRDQANLKAKMQELEAALAKFPQASDEGSKKAPTGGKWLAQLGLSDDDDEKKNKK